MRTNYQLDGNTNTEKDRAGLRLLPISEVLVREVKVITNGFAPEFGQTTGMVYNAITPSGTNDLHGSASFRFKRNPLLVAAVLPGVRPRGSRTPRRTTSRRRSAGPIKKDKLHFFGAYEYVDRSLITGGQVITVKPEPTRRRSASRLPASGVIPAHQKVNFGFGKTDYQVTPRQPACGPLLLLPEPVAVQHRRRPDDDRSRDRLHRPDGLGLGAAGVDASARTC